MKLITVIGRGHGGTRAMAETLLDSGVYMGAKLNKSTDLVPAHDLYDACRVISRHVEYLGDYRWDFSRLHTEPIDPAFERFVESYLASVLDSDAEVKGWKLPETTLCYPWIVRLFPEAYYILWNRDPRDAILDWHLTDDLAQFEIPAPRTTDVPAARAISWLYQAQIVAATPPPRHQLAVRFEDFVLNQENTVARLEAFLGIPLARIGLIPEAVGRWTRRPEPTAYPEFLIRAMPEFGYGGSEPEAAAAD